MIDSKENYKFDIGAKGLNKGPYSLIRILIFEVRTNN